MVRENENPPVEDVQKQDDPPVVERRDLNDDVSNEATRDSIDIRGDIIPEKRG